MIAANASSPQRYLFVGTGRDGTQSLTHMVREMFDREGAGRSVMHEYACREFYDAFAQAVTARDQASWDAVRQLVHDCPYDAIVGNGYAPVLPIFAEIWGPDTVLVHIKRGDRAACIRSIEDNARFFPAAYGNYSTDPAATTNRMAAFHFGEMPEAKWLELPLDEKVGWYFDKTHSLIERHAAMFSQAFALKTESLSDAVTGVEIAQILGLSGLGSPQAKHLNAHVGLEHVPAEKRDRIQWLLGRFDVLRAAEDDLYPLSYFLNAFVSWTGFQLGRTAHVGPADYRTNEELAETLAKATELLDETRRLVGLLDLQRKIQSGEVPDGPQQTTS